MNPYLLLAIGIAWVFSVGGAYLKGQHDQSNAMLAASYQEGVKSTRRFNQYTAEDLQAATKAAEKAARAQLRAQTIQHEFELEAAHGTLLTVQPTPDKPAQPAGPVRVSAAGLRVLNAAIAEYNASAVPATGSPDPLPPDGAPADRPGGGRTAPTAGIDLRPSRHLRQDAR